MKKQIKVLAIVCVISVLAVPVFAGRNDGSGSGNQYKYKNNSGNMTQSQTRQQKQLQHQYQQSTDRSGSQPRSMMRSQQRINNIDSAIAQALDGGTTN